MKLREWEVGKIVILEVGNRGLYQDSRESRNDEKLSIACTTVKIWAGYLPNVTLESCRYSDLMSNERQEEIVPVSH